MTELPRQSNVMVVPFAFALGVMHSVGVSGISELPAVDVVHLQDGRQVNHWKGSDDDDCRWELVSAP